MPIRFDQLDNFIQRHYGIGLNQSSKVEGGTLSTGAKAGPEAQSADLTGASNQGAPRTKMGEIDRLMLSVARESYKEVTKTEIASKTEGFLTRKELKEVNKLAKEADGLLAEIKKAKIADFVTDKKSKYANLVSKVVDKQSALARVLCDISNLDRFAESAESKANRRMLRDLSIKCDSRASELMTLCAEMKEAYAQAEGAATEAFADKTVGSLLTGMAASMHDNDQIKKFVDDVKAIETGLAEFSKAKNVDEAKLGQLLATTSKLSGALKSDKYSSRMDGDLHAALTKRLDNVRNDLLAFADSAVNRAKVNTLKQVLRDVDEAGESIQDAVLNYKTTYPFLAKVIVLKTELWEKLNQGIVDEDLLGELCAHCSKNRVALDSEAHALKLDSRCDIGTKYTLDKRTIFSTIGIDLMSLSQARDVILEISQRQRERGEKLEHLSGKDVISSFSRTGTASELLEARINGIKDEEMLKFPDQKPIASEKLGSGAFSITYKLTYKMEDGTTKNFVFKPDLSGRAALNKTGIGLYGSYAGTQQSINTNHATYDVAETLGLDYLTPKCYVTIHDGQYGLLMEMKPGVEAKKLAEESATIPQFNNPKNSKVLGLIAKQLNDLQWLDMATGQGDRHWGNLLIDLGTTGNWPSVTAIDNDLAFQNYLVGVGKYKVNHSQQRLSEFLKALEVGYRNTEGENWKAKYDEMVAQLESKDWIADVHDAKNTPVALTYAISKTFSCKATSVPRQMSRSLCNKLKALDDDKMEKLAKKLTKNIDDGNAVKRTIARLHDLQAIAVKYEKEGRIVEDGQWEDTEILRREMSSDLPKDFLDKISNGNMDTIRVDKTTSSILRRDFAKFVNPQFK